MNELSIGVYFLILAALVWSEVRYGLLPNWLTWGGVVSGLAFSATVPTMHGSSDMLSGLEMGIRGAIAGYLLVWIAVEIGKRLFGTQSIPFPDGCAFTIFRDGNVCTLTVGDRCIPFQEIFSRVSDRVSFSALQIIIESAKPIEALNATNVTISYDALWLEDYRVSLLDVKRVSGTCSVMRVPREALGFGVVKMTAFVGAFFGWIGAASVFVGSITLCIFVAFLYTLSSRLAPQPPRLQVSPYFVIISAAYVILLRRYGIFS